MLAINSRPAHLLESVRNYVHLLIASVFMLALTLIGYFYWHDSRRDHLDELANQFHLEAILYTSRIKEEISHLMSAPSDSHLHTHHSRLGDHWFSHYNNTLYIVGEHIQAISRLHENYVEPFDHVIGMNTVLQKASKQLNQAKNILRGSAVIDKKTLSMSASPLLEGLGHSVEQLSRLHTIARNGHNRELDTLNRSSTSHQVAIFYIVMLLAGTVVWLIMRQIQQLIDEQKNTEDKLRQSATVFENTSEGVLITDKNAKIIAVNRAFSLLTGYTEEEVLGKNPNIFQSGRHDEKFFQCMWQSLQKNGEWGGEISDRRKNGETLTKWQTISTVRDDQGQLTHYVSVFSDISHIKRSEEQLYHLAHHDDLTDLPNRLLLSARLEHSLQQAQRKATNVAVLFLDLDHFKRINDSMGHPAGDKLLQLVAERLKTIVRKEDTVARLGGDELAIVIGSLGDPDDAEKVARDILNGFSKAFRLEGQDIYMSASIGISIYPRDGQDVTVLLKNADAAMYLAKGDGRNRYRFYLADLTMSACNSLALDTSLHRALERNEFLVHYQPQISLENDVIVGVEALVRWQHPEHGLLSPARFIPVAEENGLIGEIGKWVLHSACEQAVAWQNEGLAPFRVAVNLSGRQIETAGIVQVVQDILEDTGLDPAYLELELTESSVMRQAEQAVKTLDAMRELGITIAIDDFGTGYSSLSYLKRFRVDRLKIDRSFVRDIPQDVNDVALARAIVALGHSLNLKVVAEGVETQAQKELLTSIGCDEMQGYLYSAPATASDLADLLGSQVQLARVKS